MKHYKIVKKSAFFLIAISTFAVVFNLSVAIALTAGIIKLGQPQVAKAYCDPSTSPATFTVTPNNQKVTVSFTKNNKDDIINYRIDIRKYSGVDGIMQTVEEPVATVTGTTDGNDKTKFQPDPVEIPMTYASSGAYEATVTYTNVSTIPCAYNVMSDQKKIFSFTRGVGESSITVSANPSIINIYNADGTKNSDPKTTIKAVITGHKDEAYSVWISDCKNTYQQKVGSEFTDNMIPSDPYEPTYDWIPQETDCSSHSIMVQTYNKDTKEITETSPIITVSVSGAAGGSGTGSGTTTTMDEPIKAPTTIDKFWKFTSPFQMPRSINGAGDLVLVIIKLLEYLIGAFAFIGVVVSGIQYISSGGDPAKAEKAKKNLTYCVIGIVVAVLSLSIEGIIAAFWSGPS